MLEIAYVPMINSYYSIQAEEMKNVLFQSKMILLIIWVGYPTKKCLVTESP